MPDEPPDLSGMRVLVVEDIMLVAMMIGGELQSCGCEVVGPAGRLHQALDLVRDEGTLHGALLDVNLAGESSLPVADALAARGIPFIFITGYQHISGLKSQFEKVPRLTKPFDTGEMVRLVGRCFRRNLQS